MKTWIARKYQSQCVRLGVKKSLALFLDPGLGKTSILLEILRLLIQRKKAKGALVIAPLNPLYMTWPDEIESWTNFCHFKYKILHIDDAFSQYRNTQIYLVNPERLNTIIPKLLKTPVDQWPFDVLIVDESSKFKETKSARTKLLLKISPMFKRVYIANGTPTGNGFIGLYSQMRLVDNGESLGRHKGTFLDRYFKVVGRPEWRQYTLKDKNTYKQILKDIKPSALVLSADDYVDLPELIVSPKFIKIPDKIQAIYDEINEEFCATINEEEIVAETAGTLAMMLHQICNGSLYHMQDPLATYIPPIKRGFNFLHNEKIEVLKSLIEEYQGKQILLGYKFQSDREILEKQFGKKITFFSKAKTKKDKQDIQTKWNSGKIRILAGEISSLGFGLNLQKSSAGVIVFYSLSADFEAYDQFTRRLLRSGNKSSHVHVHPILAKNAYDHLVVWKKLNSRSKSHKNFFKTMQEYQQATLNN